MDLLIIYISITQLLGKEVRQRNDAVLIKDPCNILLTLFICYCHKICFVFTSEFIFLLIYRVVDITRSGACNESQVQNMFACLFISVCALPL